MPKGRPADSSKSHRRCTLTLRAKDADRIKGWADELDTHMGDALGTVLDALDLDGIMFQDDCAEGGE